MNEKFASPRRVGARTLRGSCSLKSEPRCIVNYLTVVDELFPDRPTGAGRVAWDIAGVMRDRGHAVTMLCGADAPGIRSVEGIRVVGYAPPPASRWDPRRSGRTIDAVAAVTERELGGERWDVVHLHTPLPGTGVARALGAARRFVYTMHSPATMEAEINWAEQGLSGTLKRILGKRRLAGLERDLLVRVDAIHALSEFTKGLIGRIHGLQDKVTVVPHWRRETLRRSVTKSEARRRLGWPDSAPVIFTVRRHVARMGLGVAIEAIAPLATAGACVFVVGGDGPLRPTLEAQAATAGADGRIIFTGRLSEENLALAYQAADIFVLPTIALECFGLIIVEALAFGCPVVATDAAAIPEILRPIAPDLIVPAGDARALRDTIDRCLSGRLHVPDPAELVAYVDAHYGARPVADRVGRLLEGDRS
jgi:glycosyltransferase involved in cell wall biosynthesis